MYGIRTLIIAMGVATAAATNLCGQTSITFSPVVEPPFLPSGSWHDPLDWSPAVVPNDGRVNVTIAEGTVFLNADAAIGALLLAGPSGSISQGGDDNRKTLTVNGRFTWTGGDISSDVNIDANGGIDLSGSDDKQINTSVAGNGVYYRPIVRVRGDSTWEGGRVSGQLVGDVLDGRPLFDFQSGTFTVTSGKLFSPQLLNAGTVLVNPGDGATTTFDFLTNNGTVRIQSGTTDMDAFRSSNDPQPTSTGDFVVDQGAKLLLSGHTLTAGSSITGTGNVALSGPQFSDLVTVGGDYAITGVTSLLGNVIFAKEATTGGLVINGFNSRLTGKITAYDRIVWEAEEFGGTGEIVGLGGIDFPSEDNIQLNDSLILTLSGASSWTGTGRVDLADTSQIRQLAGGTWTISGDRILSDALFDGGGGTFDNAGTIIQTVGTTSIVPDATNTGTLVAGTGGNLIFASLTQSAGEIRADGGSFGYSFSFNRFQPTIVATGGRITGNGTVFAVTSTANTVIAPGAEGSSGTGALRFRKLTMQNGSTYAVDLAGNSPETYDRMLSLPPAEVGDLTVGGVLQIRFQSGFQNTILSTDTFTIAESDRAILGTFSNVAPGSRLTTADGMGSFIVDYGPDSPTGDNRVVLRSFEPSANAPSEAKITSVRATPISITLTWAPFGDRTHYTVQTSTTGLIWTEAKVITDGATTANFLRSGTMRFYRVASP